MTPPFISIGVTTYNRRELLQQTLTSILAQSFTDFEVIVGNDYTDEVLTGELLGIADSRIRFVNHPQNLKEVGNMNALLAMASGRYFTWLADDDLYEPDFLQSAHKLLVKYDYPAGFFSSYRYFKGLDAPQYSTGAAGSEQLLSGREFLANYFAGKLKIISVYGVFDTKILKQDIGGIEELCSSPVGLYGEYYFLVRCAMLENIIYCDAASILYRSHATSWSGNNIEIVTYLEAGHQLIRRSAKIFRIPHLSGSLNSNLLALCKLHLATFAGRSVAPEIAQGDCGYAAALRSTAIFLKEAKKTRQVYISEGGSAGYSSVSAFVMMCVKGCYTIFGMLVMNWLRKL